MPKAYGKKSSARHDPLGVQITRDENLAKYGRISQPGRRNKRDREDDGEKVEVYPCRESLGRLCLIWLLLSVGGVGRQNFKKDP